MSIYYDEPFDSFAAGADLEEVSREAATSILQRDGLTGRIWDCDTYDKLAVLDIILPEFKTRKQFEEYVLAIGEAEIPKLSPDASEGRILSATDILANLAHGRGIGYENVILRSAEHPEVNSEWAQELLDAMEPAYHSGDPRKRTIDSLQHSICTSLAGNRSINGRLLANILAVNSPHSVAPIIVSNPNMNGTSADKIAKFYLATEDSTADGLASFSLNWENVLVKLFHHPNTREDTRVLLALEIMERRRVFRQLKDNGSKVQHMLPPDFEASIVNALASLMIDPAAREHFSEEEISEVFVWIAAH